MSSIVDESPQFVTILNVHRLNNMLAGDISWPIIQKQEYLTPASFWNITKVAGKEDQYLLQDDAQNRYLIPRNDGSTGTLLSDQVFEWKIVHAGDSDVNLYQISDPSNGMLLHSGIQFENPPNSYGVNVGEPSDPSKALWVIERAHD